MRSKYEADPAPCYSTTRCTDELTRAGKDSEMQKLILTCIFIVLAGCDFDSMRSGSGAVIYSDIRSDECVVFFRTAAWLDKANQEWHVPIHGWVYENDNSAARKALFSTVP